MNSSEHNGHVLHTIGRIELQETGRAPERLGRWLDDHPSWDAERYIEQHPYSDLTLPPLDWFRSRVTDVELLHLQMFLEVKMSGTDIGQQFPSLIGSIEPSVLLLGDRHNENNDPWYHAAFGPWGGSGVWLLSSLLTLAESQLRGLAITNACEEDLPLLIEKLAPDEVVALGRNAEAECHRHDLDCWYVPHPQWYRRFRHSEREHYASLLVSTE